MNRALKFRRGLWEVAAIVIAILAFPFFIALRNARQAESMFEWTAHTEEVLDRISQARYARSRLMNQLWAFRVTRNPELPMRFHDDMQNLRKNLSDLRTLIADNPKQIQIVEELTPIVAAQLISLQKAMDNAVGGNPSPGDAATWSLPFQPSDHVRDLFNSLEKNERVLLAERSAAVRAGVARTPMVLLIACALTVLILAAAVLLVQKRNPLARGGGRRFAARSRNARLEIRRTTRRARPCAGRLACANSRPRERGTGSS
jgi:CHASE3 domain sensor protein